MKTCKDLEMISDKKKRVRSRACALTRRIGRRILKLSKYHSTLSTRLALRWPSVTARMFVRKLSLLSKVSDEGNSIGSQIFSSSPQDSLRLVQECRAMEGKLSCQGSTDAMLSAQSTLREIKREVLQADWEACTTEASRHNSTVIASRIAAEKKCCKFVAAETANKSCFLSC